jgi:hypothetical protein
MGGGAGPSRRFCLSGGRQLDRRVHLIFQNIMENGIFVDFGRFSGLAKTNATYCYNVTL